MLDGVRRRGADDRANPAHARAHGRRQRREVSGDGAPSGGGLIGCVLRGAGALHRRIFARVSLCCHLRNLRRQAVDGIRGHMRLGRGGRARRRFRRVPLAVMAAILATLLVWTVREALEPGPWQRVFATREGLTGGRLATGGIIRSGDQFVALPHPSALRRDVELRYGGRALVVPVLDVGPWNVDDAYWSNGQRPAAERGRGSYRS